MVTFTGLKLTKKAAHDSVTLLQGFTSLGWIKHQPFNGFYLFAVFLKKKKYRTSYMWDSFPFGHSLSTKPVHDMRSLLTSVRKEKILLIDTTIIGLGV